LELESIGKSIRELWHFLYAPTVVCAFMACISLFIGGDVLRRLGAAEKFKSAVARTNESKKLLEFYGLNKLMPLISLFALLFLLQAVSVLSVLIGQALPVHLSYSGDLLFHKIAGRERIAAYWEKHPQAMHLSELVPLIRDDAKAASSKEGGDAFGVRSWEEQQGDAHVRFSNTKFLMLWGFSAWLYAGWTGKRWVIRTLRLLIVWILITPAAAYFIAQYFYAAEQHAYSELSAALSIPHPVEKETAESLAITHSLILQRISIEFDRHTSDKWWDVRLLDSYYYKWVVETFVRPKETNFPAVPR